MTHANDWTDRTAPSLADFEEIAARSWQALPATFRERCQDLVIRIEDFATDEVLDQLGIPSPYELLGLYQGISLDKKSVMDPGQEPDMVFLYRRAILDYWSDGSETLGALITHVLVHEIGHHFGLSDDDMERIESSERSPV
ncbi:MAG: metallopeptidase family protein [Hyphomicrobiaceae bacterium]|nr:metallopeptidase family protein [Hyphomicrobiaceae bacterium]